MSSDLQLLCLNLGAMGAAERRELVAIPLDRLLTGISSTRDERVRLRSVAGRALLRYGLQRLTGSTEHEVGIGKHGRPFLPGLPTIDFNISHSGDWVLCALARNRRVGVDVEIVGEYLDDVVDRFADSEIASIRSRSGQERIDMLYRIWTAKEAYLKAEGSTFLISLDRFAVARTDGELGLRLPSDLSSVRWNLACAAVDRRHPYAICYSGDAVEYVPRELSTRELARPARR